MKKIIFLILIFSPICSNAQNILDKSYEDALMRSSPQSPRNEANPLIMHQLPGGNSHIRDDQRRPGWDCETLATEYQRRDCRKRIYEAK